MNLLVFVSFFSMVAVFLAVFVPNRPSHIFFLRKKLQQSNVISMSWKWAYWAICGKMDIVPMLTMTTTRRILCPPPDALVITDIDINFYIREWNRWLQAWMRHSNYLNVLFLKCTRPIIDVRTTLVHELCSGWDAVVGCL